MNGEYCNPDLGAAGFPSGQLPLVNKIAECEYSAVRGADEIDIVISRGKIIEGKFKEVYEEISDLKEA